MTTGYIECHKAVKVVLTSKNSGLEFSLRRKGDFADMELRHKIIGYRVVVVLRDDLNG